MGAASQRRPFFIYQLRALTFDDEKNTVVPIGTPEDLMIDEMGIFRTTVEVARARARGSGPRRGGVRSIG